MADLPADRVLHAAFVRSWSAHAQIVGIDVSMIADRPDVVAVLTADDLRSHTKAIRSPYNVPSYWESDYPVLADGVVRFVGEPVVLVLAETAMAAEAAANDVLVDYSEPLHVVDHIETLISDPGDADMSEAERRWRMDESDEYGDLATAINGDCVSVEDVFRTQRLAASPRVPRRTC